MKYLFQKMHADVLYENGNSRTVIKNGILSHRPILIIDKRVCKDSSNSSVASSNDNDDKIILDTSESSSACEATIEEQHVNEYQVIFSKFEKDGKKMTLLVNINEDWVEVSLSVSNPSSTRYHRDLNLDEIYNDLKTLDDNVVDDDEPLR